MMSNSEIKDENLGELKAGKLQDFSDGYEMREGKYESEEWIWII